MLVLSLKACKYCILGIAGNTEFRYLSYYERCPSKLSGSL